VVIAGPIDGDTGSWTKGEIANAELSAKELEANGVQVYRFYTPNTDWTQIQAAANGAQFLIYRGHGIRWSSMPTPQVGGFELKDRIYTNTELHAGLKLAPNAIVMLYACLASGSTNEDTASISIAEAQRRVGQYSDPFFANGAAGYYSNWYGDAFQIYIRNLFQGKTLGDAFKAYSSYNPNQVAISTLPSNPALPMWLAYENWTNYPIPPYQYDDTFAGNPNKTLVDLFAPPAMKLSTNAITYLAQPNYPAVQYRVNITSNSATSFTWSASPVPSKPSWLTISSTGSTGTPLLITIQPQPGLGTYVTDIQVTGSDPMMLQYQQTIQIKLFEVATVRRIFLPTTVR
jgi:hypothetical protein